MMMIMLIMIIEVGSDDDDDTVNGSVKKKPHPAVEATANSNSRKLVDALYLLFSFVSFLHTLVLVMVMTTVSLTIVRLS